MPAFRGCAKVRIYFVFNKTFKNENFVRTEHRSDGRHSVTAEGNVSTGFALRGPRDLARVPERLRRQAARARLPRRRGAGLPAFLLAKKNADCRGEGTGVFCTKKVRTGTRSGRLPRERDTPFAHEESADGSRSEAGEVRGSGFCAQRVYSGAGITRPMRPHTGISSDRRSAERLVASSCCVRPIFRQIDRRGADAEAARAIVVGFGADERDGGTPPCCRVRGDAPTGARAGSAPTDDRPPAPSSGYPSGGDCPYRASRRPRGIGNPADRRSFCADGACRGGPGRADARRANRRAPRPPRSSPPPHRGGHSAAASDRTKCRR